MKRKRELIITDLFEKMIRNTNSGRRLQPNGSRISKGTVENYKFTRNPTSGELIDRKNILENSE